MIDEKKLIEKLEAYKSNWKMADDFNEGIASGLKIAIRTAKHEPKVGEWIPVTELDLDHNQEALIKLDDGFICSAKFLISDKGNHCGFYHKHVGFLQCPQVVAWMPYNADM
jgi:hypothetical protein